MHLPDHNVVYHDYFKYLLIYYYFEYFCTYFSEHVREVYNGNNGIFTTVQPDSLLIDCSTIDGQSAIDMSNLAKDKGAHYVDAPVSGGENNIKT